MRTESSRGLPFRLALHGAAALLLAFLVLPFLGLVLKISPRAFFQRLGDPAILEALRLSLIASVAATAIVVVFGTPVAWLLAMRRFPGKRFLEVLVDLPMVLPPTVAGFALLLAFGRMGLTGHALGVLGVSLPFTTLGVIAAQVFMSAPFFIAPARTGFAGVDRRLLDVASTLRATPSFQLFHVVLPLARPALVSGATMACARALGEFGATITFAGNLPGVTQTMPLAVYTALQSDLDAAITLSVVLLVASFGLLLGLRLAGFGPWGSAGRPG